MRAKSGLQPGSEWHLITISVWYLASATFAPQYDNIVFQVHCNYFEHSHTYNIRSYISVFKVSCACLYVWSFHRDSVPLLVVGSEIRHPEYLSDPTKLKMRSQWGPRSLPEGINLGPHWDRWAPSSDPTGNWPITELESRPSWNKLQDRIF